MVVSTVSDSTARSTESEGADIELVTSSVSEFSSFVDDLRFCYFYGVEYVIT